MTGRAFYEDGWRLGGEATQRAEVRISHAAAAAEEGAAAGGGTTGGVDVEDGNGGSGCGSERADPKIMKMCFITTREPPPIPIKVCN
jgi:hypothetical protein